MSSELFEQFEYEFGNISAALARKINSQIPNYSGEQRKATIRAAERELEEAEETIAHMQRELQAQPSNYRGPLSNRLRSYQGELSKLQRDLKSVTLGGDGGGGASARDQLLSGSALDNDPEAGQRSRILDAHDTMHRTGQRIENSHRVAAESEQIGREILGDLGQQRETLLRARDRLDDTDENLSRGNRILKGMARRAVTNKLVLVAIIIVLLALIGITAYMRFFRK